MRVDDEHFLEKKFSERSVFLASLDGRSDFLTPENTENDPKVTGIRPRT